MFARFIVSVFLIYLSLGSLHAAQMSAVMLPSTESDPDSFIAQSVNVINGDYCETALDLEIDGPDALTLQRYYNSKNYMTGKDFGGWRIFPQTLLVTGRDPQNKECKVGQDRFEWVYAFTGERSGGILSYSGWRKISGDTKDPLKIEVLKDTTGMVNSFAREMSGQTNHLNNRMHFKQETCELILGDGTQRIYQKVKAVPTEIFGEEIALNLAAKVTQPQYFLLISETLPSGNVILFSYDEKGHIASVEMKDFSQNKTYSWIHFIYNFNSKGCFISATTSDEKKLIYAFEKLTIGNQSIFILKEVKGNYGIPISYDYAIKGSDCFLTKKRLPEGRFVEIVYDDAERVKMLKGPSALSGKPETAYSFNYGDKCTEVSNAAGIKTRYRYDDRLQLMAMEYLGPDGKLYRTDKKYYGKTKQDATFLLARTISDATGRIHSYRCFKYDGRGNVLEEKLYGNLTGKQGASLQVDVDGQIINPDQEECHTKTFSYSEDGFNLLTRLGDCKKGQTSYHYKKNTNLITAKFIYDGATCSPPCIRKREYRFYNGDGVCIKIIEDDGRDEDIKYVYDATERHITEIKPKENLPGVGLPEVIEEKAVDLKTKNEIFVKKLVNTYSPQGQLLSCATYDSNRAHAFTVGKTYNHLGQVTSETDPEGKIISYSYDGIGNQILVSIPHENKTIERCYDFKSNLIQTVESAGSLHKTLQNTYDILGRKIASTDQFGETTHFKYDAFGHLTKVIYPTVLDEYEKSIQPMFSYTYDIFGNVLSITDPKGYTTYKTYNLRGDPTKIHYPDGSIEMFKYDTEGSLHRSLTRDQIITVYEYDYLGRVSYEEVSFVREKSEEPFITGREYKYNGFRLSSLRNRYLSTDTFTAYRHDPVGRVIAILQYPYGESENHAQSRKTEIGYNSLGRESKRKVWFDFGSSDYSVECVEYDLLGNIIEKRTENAAGNIQLRKGFAYDSAGHCVEEFTFSGKPIITTAYDSFGEPILFTDASDNETKVLIDYGKNSLKKTIINSEGVQTKIDFDALGRTISIIKKDATGTLLSSQSIFYDGIGNKSLEENAIIADAKQLGVQKTRWVYGPMGRIEELIEAEGSPEEKRTVYSYNTLGKLAAKTLSGAAAPLAYTYTKQGWLSKIHYQEGKNDLLVNNYTYDRRGNITSASALGNQSVERTYNIFNQILQETVKDGEGKYTLKFQYDRKGRVKSIALPDDSSIAYTYDGIFGREAKRLSGRGEELYSHTYTSYDESGKLLEETLIGYCGDRRTYYDLNGRKTLIETDYYTENVPSNGYSTLGNLLSLQRKGDFPIENSSYTYNSLSQLTSEKNNIQKTYSYDSLDNRLKENKDDLLYNSLNQLIAQAKAEFSYDPQGNLLRKTLDGEETHFKSNILSQLIAIEKPDQTYLTFAYDPFGRRTIKKTYDSKEKNKKTLSTTRSFYLGFHELGILNEKGAIKKLRVPGIAGSQISLKSIAIEIEDQTCAVLHDISGNVIALLDPASREIIESYTYSAFGIEKIYNTYQKQISSSALGNHWLYAEKPSDEETGLINFGFRYYDPSIGRWISKDPAGFIDGPNLYAYCHNNPLRCSDLFGLESQVNEEQFYGEVENHCFCAHHRTCKRGGDLDKTNSSQLPTIKYCDDFEKMYGFYEPSNTYQVPGMEISDLAIGFINGVWNDFDSAYENALYLSKLAGGHSIHAVYNATHGNKTDLVECDLGLRYIATEPVRLLHKMWNSYFEKSSADAKFLMICHSQGAIHVRNALLDYPPEFRERVIVAAIAPGAYIYQKTCAQVTHYRNGSIKRDFIPRIDKRGADREKDTIINLISHSEAALFDHQFQSLTYQDALIDELKRFLGGKF